MRNIVRFKDSAGNDIYIEARATDDSGIERASRDASTVEGGRLEEILAKIRPAAKAIAEAVRDAVSPDELTVKISLVFDSKVGAFVFTCGTESTFEVECKWTASK